MIFRQLFDPETSSYSYLLADERTREAVLIDSVAEQLERDLSLVRELELRLVYALETHVHADHVTGAGRLREALGARVAVSERSGVHNADQLLRDGEWLAFGGHRLEARATPGHTGGCMTFVADGLAFTGDALLIRGCGRTDFQEGDSATLYRSVRERILSLPETTALYPAHDYRGRTQTTVAEELRHNPRLGSSKSREAFVQLMAELKLAYPKRMDEAVPANLYAGLGPGAAPSPHGPTPVAAVMQQLGRQDAAENWLGAGI
jgi:glyoxylase-like metal-dependent hydrolase (beta-lactamase superfamily II)